MLWIQLSFAANDLSLFLQIMYGSCWLLFCANKKCLPLQLSSNYCSIHHLTILPQVRIGSESIAHEAEGRMGYWLRGHEGERNNNDYCFSKIQLVGQKYRDKTTLTSQTRFSRYYFGFQSRRFSLLVGYHIYPSSSSTNQNTALIIDH